MADKKLTSLSIKGLINDKELSGKVYNMMLQHQSYNFILKYLESKGYKMAKGSLTNFKKKVEEARDTGVPLEYLADGRRKSIDKVDPKKISGFTGKDGMHIVKSSRENIQEAKGSYNDAVPKEMQPNSNYISNADVLEELVKKGFNTLQEMDTVDSATLLKGIEMYQKYFSQDARGLSQEALKQYQVIMQARVFAITQVVMQYVPNDKKEEARKEMEKAEQKVIDSLGQDNDTKRLLAELEKNGMI